MVYGQQPQPQPQAQQYGQPQYGQPPPQPAPQPGPIGMPPAEIKWSGLTTGGAFKVPVIAFIGRLTEIVKDSGSAYGLRIVEKYDQVQILESPVPWPWATLDISIKYSDRESSGWGHHVESAKAIGLAQQAATLDQAMAELVGKVFEMRQSEQGYGEDKQSGQAMKGDVWKFVRQLAPGQPQAQSVAPPVASPQVAIPAQAAVVQPQPAVAQPAPLPQPAAAVPPAATPAAPPAPAAPAASVGFNTTLDPTDTASVRAKKLLHNKALNEWLAVALVDDKIKADPSFINTIYDQSFIVSLKASNQITQGADGKFVVVA